MQLRNVTFLKAVVYGIGVIILSLSIFALPPLAKHTAEIYPEYAHLQYPVLIGLYLTVVPFCFALYQALKLLSYIESNDAFSELAVDALGIIKQCARIISILYIVGMILLGIQNALHPSIAIIGFAIFFTSIVIMFFAAVLQELLTNVLKIKLENDLTI